MAAPSPAPRRTEDRLEARTTSSSVVLTLPGSTPSHRSALDVFHGRRLPGYSANRVSAATRTTDLPVALTSLGRLRAAEANAASSAIGCLLPFPRRTGDRSEARTTDLPVTLTAPRSTPRRRSDRGVFRGWLPPDQPLGEPRLGRKHEQPTRGAYARPCRTTPPKRRGRPGFAGSFTAPANRERSWSGGTASRHPCLS